MTRQYQGIFSAGGRAPRIRENSLGTRLTGNRTSTLLCEERVRKVQSTRLNLKVVRRKGGRCIEIFSFRVTSCQWTAKQPMELHHHDLVTDEHRNTLIRIQIVVSCLVSNRITKSIYGYITRNISRRFFLVEFLWRLLAKPSTRLHDRLAKFALNSMLETVIQHLILYICSKTGCNQFQRFLVVFN